MAAPPPRLVPLKQPHIPDQRTPEQRYWRSFKVLIYCLKSLANLANNLQSPVIIKESASITHTHFSPTSPYNLAISASAAVKLYNPTSRQVVKTLSRFKDTV